MGPCRGCGWWWLGLVPGRAPPTPPPGGPQPPGPPQLPDLQQPGAPGWGAGEGRVTWPWSSGCLMASCEERVGWSPRAACRGKGAANEDDAGKREAAVWGSGRGWLGGFVSLGLSFPICQGKNEVTCHPHPPHDHGIGGESGGLGPGSPAVSSAQRTRRTCWRAPVLEVSGSGWGKAGPHWMFLSSSVPGYQALLTLTFKPGAPRVWGQGGSRC